MNESEQHPVNNEVKLCLDDILTTLDGTIHQQQQASPILLSPPPQTWTRPFLEDNILLAYLVNSKETELRRTRDYGLSDPMSEGVYCEYCGDSDKHITDIRGGGGLDEICVQWDLDWDAEDPSPKPIGMAFYSCRSCFEDTEDPDLPIDSGICASCGIHNNLLGNEEETMMSQDYLEYREINLPSFTPSPHRRGFCPHCVEVHTGSQLVDGVIRRERYHGPEEIVEEIDESLRTAGLADMLEVSNDSLEFEDDEEYEGEYEGEYENEKLPENNTEKAKEIKDTVREVGEKMFDVQDQLREGDYLEIMNLLQKVTNSVNSL